MNLAFEGKQMSFHFQKLLSFQPKERAGQTIHLSFHRLDPMHCHLQTQILPFLGPERDTNSPKQSILRTDSSSFADTEPDRSNEEGELPTKLVIPHPGIESEECSKLPLTPHWILKLQGIDRIN